LGFLGDFFAAAVRADALRFVDSLGDSFVGWMSGESGRLRLAGDFFRAGGLRVGAGRRFGAGLFFATDFLLVVLPIPRLGLALSFPLLFAASFPCGFRFGFAPLARLRTLPMALERRATKQSFQNVVVVFDLACILGT
jgi:hypothetical protein